MPVRQRRDGERDRRQRVGEGASIRQPRHVPAVLRQQRPPLRVRGHEDDAGDDGRAVHDAAARQEVRDARAQGSMPYLYRLLASENEIQPWAPKDQNPISVLGRAEHHR